MPCPFRSPPQRVLAVMNTLCLMFRQPPGWESGKQLLIREDFYDDLVYYDKKNVPDDIYQALGQIGRRRCTTSGWWCWARSASSRRSFARFGDRFRNKIERKKCIFSSPFSSSYCSLHALIRAYFYTLIRKKSICIHI